MSVTRIISLVLLLGITFLFSCREDINITDTDIDVNPPEILVTASVSGIVVDEASIPVEGVLINIGTNIEQTDENGVFVFRDIQMNQYGTLIKAKKSGYFDGSKFVQPELNAMSFVKFMLLAKENVGNFNAGVGGSVSTNTGASVSFPGNSIMNSSGNAYTGEVEVFAKWIDPTASDAILQMPGDLRAIDGDEEFVQLATYGMVGVELESPSGDKLQIAEGSQATIEFPLPASIQANAPSTILLWSFDDDSGYWVEEGSATKQGDKYVANVGHFSFWNCDAPFPLIELTGSVVDANGNGVANVSVRIEFTTQNTVGYGYTNENGVFSGKVPKNEALVIKLLDDCGVEIYSANIGPFSENTTLDPIVFSSTENSLTITGTLTDCDAIAVSNGYVRVGYGGGFTTIFVEDDGSFNQTISICAATQVDIRGVDIDNQLQSDELTFNVEGLSDLDVGTLSACEELEEYFYYTLDSGITVFATDVGAEIGLDSMGNANALYIFASIDSTGSTTGFADLAVEASDVGDYTPIYMFLGDPNNPNGQGVFCQDCSGMTVSITAYGDINEPVIGTFDGTVDNQGTVVAVNGAFKFIREF